MRIGIDLDECLAEFVFGFLNYYNNKHGTYFEAKDFKKYELWSVIGGNRDDAINEVYQFYKTDYFKELPVIFGSKNVVEELKKFSEVLIVTSRQNDIADKTTQWLDQHFHNKFSKIIFTNEWGKSGVSKKKSEICKSLRLDFLIEDNLECALDCARYSKAFLLDKPWNQNKKLPENIKRVYNWHEILERIEEIKNGK